MRRAPFVSSLPFQIFEEQTLALIGEHIANSRMLRHLLSDIHTDSMNERFRLTTREMSLFLSSSEIIVKEEEWPNDPSADEGQMSSVEPPRFSIGTKNVTRRRIWFVFVEQIRLTCRNDACQRKLKQVQRGTSEGQRFGSFPRTTFPKRRSFSFKNYRPSSIRRRRGILSVRRPMKRVITPRSKS